MNNNFFKIFLLFILACIWGSSFILMKRGMYAFDGSLIFSDSQVASLRMSLAAIIFLPFFITNLKKIKKLSDLLFLTVVGICGNFIPAFLFTFAETKIDSAHAGLLNCFTPIFTLLIGTVFFSQKLKLFQLIGVLISFIGLAFLLIYGQDINRKGLFIIPSLAIVFATFLYGISLNTIKHKLSHFKSIEISSLSFGILFLPSIFSLLTNDTITVFKKNPNAFQGLFFVGILSVFGTAIALIIFNKLIAISNTLFSSSVTFLIPIVALFIGVYVGEEVSIIQIFSIIIILLGIIFANYYKKKEKY